MKTSQTEQAILRLLYRDQDWMKVNHTMISGPSADLPTGYMILSYDRDKAYVHGVVATRIFCKMIFAGKIKGDAYCNVETRNVIHRIILEGDALTAANDCDTGADLLYVRPHVWRLRRELGKLEGVA